MDRSPDPVAKTQSEHERIETYIPQIADAVWREFPRLRGRLEGPLRHAEQGQHLALQVGQLGVKHLEGVTLPPQGVALGEAEQAQDLFGGGTPALALLGVDRQLLDEATLHRQAELALEECLYQ